MRVSQIELARHLPFKPASSVTSPSKILRGSSLSAILMVAFSLTGCASLRGSQPRLTMADLERFEAVCPSKAELEEADIVIGKGAYRDRVIRICVQAIESKYAEFRDQLSVESASSNLISELLAQGLSTGASLVTNGSTSRRLAAGSALALGVGATINKDLFYKQTMPAIIASMDARRAKILTSIVEAQNRDPDAKSYTLDRAGFDLDLLQQAGSMASAVQELTSTAVENKLKADAALDRAVVLDIGTAQEISVALDERYHSATALVRRLERQGKEAELRAIAASLGLNPLPGWDTLTLSARIRAEAARATTEIKPEDQERVMQRVEGALLPYRSL